MHILSDTQIRILRKALGPARFDLLKSAYEDNMRTLKFKKQVLKNIEDSKRLTPHRILYWEYRLKEVNLVLKHQEDTLFGLLKEVEEKVKEKTRKEIFEILL